MEPTSAASQRACCVMLLMVSCSCASAASRAGTPERRCTWLRARPGKGRSRLWPRIGATKVGGRYEIRRGARGEGCSEGESTPLLLGPLSFCGSKRGRFRDAKGSRHVCREAVSYTHLRAHETDSYL
eukprot:4514192-Pleurochrysis_carterae.AAC.1